MDGKELLKLASDALDLINQAVYFDSSGNNIIASCDYYDLGVLNIDELLNKLDRKSDVWNQLLELRSNYDDRLEYLREIECSKYDAQTANSVSDYSKVEHDSPSVKHTSNAGIFRPSSNGSSGSGSGSSCSSKKLRRQSRVAFKDLQICTNTSILDQDICTSNSTYDEPPQSVVELPYWQLNAICKSIETGTFLTPSLYIPHLVWSQVGLKFSGLHAKSIAFQNIITIVNSSLSHLPIPTVDAIDFDDSFYNLTIKDISAKMLNGLDAIKAIHEDFILLQNQLSKPFPFIKEIVIHTDSDAGSSPSASSSTSTQSHVVSQVARMAINLGKNVRKYAEVGYQRLGAIATRVTEEEFDVYTSLIRILCKDCQIFNRWYLCAELLREQVIIKSTKPENLLTVDAFITTTENLLSELHVIASFIREVVCEILLRDIESLMERYLNKTRKSFSRMYWDDDSLG